MSGGKNNVCFIRTAAAKAEVEIIQTLLCIQGILQNVGKCAFWAGGVGVFLVLTAAIYGFAGLMPVLGFVADPSWKYKCWV